MLEEFSDKFDDRFTDWCIRVADTFAMQKPYIRRFPISEFDGCTLAPDIARDCCFMHDIRYWYAESNEEKREADKQLLACLKSKADKEDKIWRWFWLINARAFWVAVSIFGGGIVKRRRSAWERAR